MNGVGIGTGCSSSGNSTIVTLWIQGGNISATGGSDGGAGIGTGIGNSTIKNLTLMGGTVITSGTFAGIGPSAAATIDFVGLSGTLILSCHAREPDSCIKASSIAVGNGSVHIETMGDRLFGTVPDRDGPLNLTIIYGSAMSTSQEPLSGLELTFVHVGNISLPCCDSWDIRVFGDSSEVYIANEFVPVRGFVQSVPGEGSYSMLVKNGEYAGHLCPMDADCSFNIHSDHWFFPQVHFVEIPPTSTDAFTGSIQGLSMHSRTVHTITIQGFLFNWNPW
jgi:hypothetical protein